jgi:hypothetical protein
MAVGVFGLLGADELVYSSEEDCYSIFHGLSSLAGVLRSPNPDEPTRGLWEMNDAGGPWLGNDPTGRRGQFQVRPITDGNRPLPVEAFTMAAVAAVRRFGPLELHGLEYYLPIDLAGPATSGLEHGRHWFALAEARRRTPLTVTLDSGDSSVVVERRHEILQTLEDVSPAAEALAPAVSPDAEPADFADPVPWRWWLGEGPPHTVTLSATATEWTPLAVGRVVTFVVEACRSIGMTDHIGVRVVRSGTA